MPSSIQSITQRVADNLSGGRADVEKNTFIRDATLPGFAVLIGRTKSSYVIEGRAGRGGKVTRYTLGTVGRLDLDEARKQAKQKIADLAAGRDPAATLRAARSVSLTMKQALEILSTTRTMKASTVADYERSLRELGWLDRQLSSIKEADVKRAYDAEHPTASGRRMRSFRACWNAARAEYKTLPECPTSALKNVRRKWATAPRKRRMVKDDALPQWRKQVAALDRRDVADLLLFIHYTGCRIGETRALRVDDVDPRRGTYTLAEPKNGNPVTLPLTTQTRAIVERRIADADADGHLFPQGDVRKSHASVNACAWSYHDCRRGFITAAHRLGVDNEHARRLTNHATPTDDAHANYIMTEPDTLRPDAQRIANHLDKLAKAKTKRR